MATDQTTAARAGDTSREAAASLIESALDEFHHQEGARHRSYDFAIDVLHDLVAAGWRDPHQVDQIAAELRDRRTEDLDLRGLLSPNGQDRVVPMELGDSLVPAVEWLIGEVERLRDETEAQQAREARVWERIRAAQDDPETRLAALSLAAEELLTARAAVERLMPMWRAARAWAAGINTVAGFADRQADLIAAVDSLPPERSDTDG